MSVGDGAYTAAGSTITDDVPAGALGIARARQVNKEDWAAPKLAAYIQKKQRLEAAAREMKDGQELEKTALGHRRQTGRDTFHII